MMSPTPSVTAPYLDESQAPSRADIEALPGLVLLEFGTAWCGHCQAAQEVIGEALRQHPDWRHIKVEDGPGRALGRSFRVKLWPTLVLLRDGQELARTVRPNYGDSLKLSP
jgi:thioredoxin 1